MNMNRQLPVPTDGLQRYMAEINRFPLLSRAEEHELALRYERTGEVDAAQRLVLSNLRFVVKIAYEYQNYGFRMTDLIQEGNVGLLLAVKKFDPNKGFRLISYAVWWIRAYIQNFILKSWSLVRIGTTKAQRKLFYKLRQAKQKLVGEAGTGDFDQALQSEQAHQIAEKYALRDDEVLDMDVRLSGRDLYLDTPVGGENKTRHLDLLSAPDNQEDAVAEQEEATQVSATVRLALEVLNPRERYIITQRLMAEEPKTLQAIGNHFGISRERARQLEARAKKKLREALSEAA